MTVAMVWCVNVVCVSSLVTLYVYDFPIYTRYIQVHRCSASCLVHEYNVCVGGGVI